MSTASYEDSLLQVQEAVGLPIVYLSECDSTNRVALDKIQSGWRGVVVTDHQTAGRGRLQRTWVSDPGANVLLSWAFDVDCDLQQVPRIPLLMAAALADEFGVYVKWPNDIWDENGLKLGGILSSLQPAQTVGTPHTVVVGVGINVYQTLYPSDVQATSLTQIETGPIQRSDIVRRVLTAMQSVSISDTFERWRKHSYTLGKWVSVGGITGQATGIREDGALIVGGIPVTTGDVQLVENGDVTRN